MQNNIVAYRVFPNMEKLLKLEVQMISSKLLALCIKSQTSDVHLNKSGLIKPKHVILKNEEL